MTARVAYRAGDWESSFAGFSRAGAAGPLDVDDLDAMAAAAWRLGHEREAVRIAEMVFLRLTRTDLNAAAMKAVELGAAWLMRGDLNIGRGWMNRARELLAGWPQTAAAGYLICLDGVVAALTDGGDASAAQRALADDALVEQLVAEQARLPWTGEILYITLRHHQRTADLPRLTDWLSISEELTARRLANIRAWANPDLGPGDQ